MGTPRRRRRRGAAGGGEAGPAEGARLGRKSHRAAAGANAKRQPDVRPCAGRDVDPHDMKGCGRGAPPPGAPVSKACSPGEAARAVAAAVDPAHAHAAEVLARPRAA